MIRRIAAIAAIVIAMVTAMLVGTAAPASASSTRNVTITVGDWNCRQNGRYSGKVASVLIDVVPGRNSAARWIGGNKRTVNIIYSPNGSRVTIAAVVFCKTSWWGSGYYREIAAGRWVTSRTSTNWRV